MIPDADLNALRAAARVSETSLLPSALERLAQDRRLSETLRAQLATCLDAVRTETGGGP